jgi:hypothetical protein
MAASANTRVLLADRVVERSAATAFAVTLGLSATLLFVLQPMFAKMTLPLLGGAPGVWNTAVAFFQGVLLLGYLYAHGLQRAGGIKTQLAIHGCVLAFATLFLPIAVSVSLGDPPAGAPAVWLVGLYAISVGPPFFALSATAPLLQAWYARTGRSDAKDPYHLYAASNLGSLAALLAYPVIIEPVLTLSSQGLAWSWGYAALAASIASCAFLAMRAGSHGAVAAADVPAQAPVQALGTERISWAVRARWVVLAAIPSSLLLGVTTHLTTDVASAPFLWVAPLALYLLTFVIAFARRPAISENLSRRAAPMALIAASAAMVSAGFGWFAEGLVHLGALFVLALACHHRLAGLRPGAGRLTEFYAYMSLGGVIGGAFNAFLAPVVFDGVVEYPLALAATVVLAGAAREASRRNALAAIAVGGAAALLAGAHFFGLAPSQLALRIVAALALVAMFLLRSDPRKLAVTFLLMVGTVPLLARGGDLVTQERSFFGVWRVIDRGDVRELSHGTTVHGAQSADPARRLQPLTYYRAEGPIGEAVRRARERLGVLDVGAIGLGAGSMACHALPGDAWTFFEIDPVVVRMARDPELFSFMSDCAPDAPVRLGDARLTLADEPVGGFDVLILDAFASDVVPAHLVTREAFALYMSRLAPDGILVAHISNRMVELEGPIADIVASHGWTARTKVYLVAPEIEATRAASSTHALVIARRPESLAAFDEDTGWTPSRPAGERVWTDDRNNIPAAMWAKQFGW